MKRNIWLSACHLLGKTNVEADKMSRHLSSDMEWKLIPLVFDKLKHKCDPLEIDLFASRLNSQLDKYISYLPDPGALSVDAFATSWKDINGYAFPPFSVLGRVLQKVETDQANMTLIAQLWTTQPWFSKALQLVAANSYILPKMNNLLVHPMDPKKKHPLQTMRLVAFRLCGKQSDILNCRMTLPKLFYPHGVPQRRDGIGLILKHGCSFVINNKFIHLNHL